MGRVTISKNRGKAGGYFVKINGRVQIRTRTKTRAKQWAQTFRKKRK